MHILSGERVFFKRKEHISSQNAAPTTEGQNLGINTKNYEDNRTMREVSEPGQNLAPEKSQDSCNGEGETSQKVRTEKQQLNVQTGEVLKAAVGEFLGRQGM